ncbi:MAG TPA: transposase [Aquabacterium sp.]|nr:transposase [Aquabacterium sp.]
MHIMSVAMQTVSKPRRRVHSEAFKRKVVELSLVPGVSVAAIALEHGINANLLFGWRKAHLKSCPGSQADRRDVTAPATLLPVEVVAASPPGAVPAVAAHRGASPPGSIEIEVAGARVRVRGSVDEASLRSVLAALRG